MADGSFADFAAVVASADVVFILDRGNHRLLRVSGSENATENATENAAESAETKGSKKAGKSKRNGSRHQAARTNTILYTNAMYKRRFCAHYPMTDQCKRGSLCAFAHTRAEYRGSLLAVDEEHEGKLGCINK